MLIFENETAHKFICKARSKNKWKCAPFLRYGLVHNSTDRAMSVQVGLRGNMSTGRADRVERLTRPEVNARYTARKGWPVLEPYNSRTPARIDTRPALMRDRTALETLPTGSHTCYSVLNRSWFVRAAFCGNDPNIRECSRARTEHVLIVKAARGPGLRADAGL